jgi:hypothetical protein
MSETNSNVIPMPAAQSAGAKFTITAILEGFPVTIELEGKAEALKGIIERLRAIGAQPPQANGKLSATNTDVPPRCNLHNRPMKPSKKPGGWFCPAKLGDGSYCSEKIDA